MVSPIARNSDTTGSRDQPYPKALFFKNGTTVKCRWIVRYVEEAMGSDTVESPWFRKGEALIAAGYLCMSHPRLWSFRLDGEETIIILSLLGK